MLMRGVIVAAIAAAMVATATAQGPSTDLAAEATGPRAARQEPRLGFWQVRDVQMRLARMGYPVGAVDGALGPRTRTALRGFQQHRGFRPSGRLDPQTLAALDVATSSATSGASR